MVERRGTRRDSGFVLETFQGPRLEAREYVRAYMGRYPVGGYMTEIASWHVEAGDEIVFTMRRLPSAD